MIVLTNGAVGVRAMVIAMVLKMVAALSGIWTAFLVSQFLGFLMPGAPLCLSGLVPDSLYTVHLCLYKGLTGLAVCNCTGHPDPSHCSSYLTPHASHVTSTSRLLDRWPCGGL